MRQSGWRHCRKQRRYPHAILLYSGRDLPIQVPVKMTNVADQALIQLGADPSRIILERESRNTWENALFSRQIVHPKPGQIWLLITSASHMSRALAVFKALDW